MPSSIIRLILILTMISSFSGCSTTGAGGADSSQSVFSNQDISYNIEEAIDSNAELNKKTNITATTYNGVVLLTGQAPTVDLQQQAVQLAQGVKGVKMIYNEITIAKPQSASVSASDSWITTKIRTDLLLNQGWSANDFKVVTEGGVVYMMGKVSPPQAELATQSASQVSGVKKVVELFESKPAPAANNPSSTTTTTSAASSTTSSTPAAPVSAPITGTSPAATVTH